MEKNYIDNLKAVAGVGGNKISFQILSVLREKYHLTDEEMAEMKEYCRQHTILIYDEEKNKDPVEDTKAAKDIPPILFLWRNRLRNGKYIARRIMHIAAVGARKRAHENGWLCGTYASRIRNSLERRVIRTFDETEIDYIINHLPAENDEDISFELKDVNDPQKAVHYNNELNSMIPRLYINRFYSDVFDE